MIDSPGSDPYLSTRSPSSHSHVNSSTSRQTTSTVASKPQILTPSEESPKQNPISQSTRQPPTPKPRPPKKIHGYVNVSSLIRNGGGITATSPNRPVAAMRSLPPETAKKPVISPVKPMAFGAHRPFTMFEDESSTVHYARPFTVAADKSENPLYRPEIIRTDSAHYAVTGLYEDAIPVGTQSPVNGTPTIPDSGICKYSIKAGESEEEHAYENIPLERGISEGSEDYDNNVDPIHKEILRNSHNPYSNIPLNFSRQSSTTSHESGHHLATPHRSLNLSFSNPVSAEQDLITRPNYYHSVSSSTVTETDTEE